METYRTFGEKVTQNGTVINALFGIGMYFCFGYAEQYSSEIQSSTTLVGYERLVHSKEEISAHNEIPIVTTRIVQNAAVRQKIDQDIFVEKKTAKPEVKQKIEHVAQVKGIQKKTPLPDFVKMAKRVINVNALASGGAYINNVYIQENKFVRNIDMSWDGKDIYVKLKQVSLKEGSLKFRLSSGENFSLKCNIEAMVRCD